MERLPSLAIAIAGILAGLLIATGHGADVAAPLVFALAGACAWRRVRPGRHFEP